MMKHKNGTIICKGADVNMGYFYVDSDIVPILRSRIIQEGSQDSVFALRPVGEVEHEALESEIDQEKIRNQSNPNRVLLIPYLIGNPADGHWVGIAVHFHNNAAQKIEYYDSVKGGKPSARLQAILKSKYGQSVDITKVKKRITQDDNTSCGPCTIENLVNAANAKDNHADKLTLIEIRKRHIEIMEGWESGYLFYDRQKNNIGTKYVPTSTVTSVENVTAAMGGVSISNSKAVKKSAAIHFPRCEYRTRFKDTSDFGMRDPKYWNSYFRSTSRGGNADRLADRGVAQKTFANLQTNSPKKGNATHPASKTGTFYSPFQHEDYKKILLQNPKRSEHAFEEGSLYDLVLEYKKRLCQQVTSKVRSLSKGELLLNSYYANEYECVMVHIPAFEEFPGESEGPSFCKIVMSYFVAITNQKAWEQNVPIELVIRSSFGHNLPSVAETGNSFRISIGLVPRIYAEILAQSLIELNDEFLVPLLNETLILDASNLQKINAGIEEYNESKQEKFSTKKNEAKHKKIVKKIKGVEPLKRNSKLLKVLRQVGDSSGKKLICQLVRKNSYLDLLVDYVLAEFDKGCPNIALPLCKVIEKIRYGNEVSLGVTSDDYKKERYLFNEQENPDIKSDDGFWRIVNDISQVLRSETSEVHKFVYERKLLGLYAALERWNLDFIRNSGHQKADDGYGSDSDCEISSESQSFYSRKITVATGMRAINLAQFLSVYYMRTKGYCYDTSAHHMYYETEEAVKTVADILKAIDPFLYEYNGNGTIRYIDLTHCASSGEKKVKLDALFRGVRDNDIVVLDYTSATNGLIKYSTLECLKKADFVILLSSGLKNEQLGSDMNPYGTIRIVTKDILLLEELYLVLVEALNQGREWLPKELHQIRKSYKEIGATVTSKSIFRNNYKAVSRVSDYSIKGAQCKNVLFEDKFKNMIQLINDPEFQDSGVYLLYKEGKVSLSAIVDIYFQSQTRFYALLEFSSDDLSTLLDLFGLESLSWDREKQDFFLSSETQEFLLSCDNETSIDELEKCYDFDSNSASKIIEKKIRGDLDQSFQDAFYALQSRKAPSKKKNEELDDYQDVESVDTDDELERMRDEEVKDGMPEGWNADQRESDEDENEDEINTTYEEESFDDDSSQDESDTTDSSVSYLTNVIYDNPILNERALLKSAYEYGGSSLVNRLIDIGMDYGNARLVIESYESSGLEAMSLELMKLEVNKSLNYQQAEADLINYASVFSHLSEDGNDQQINLRPISFSDMFDKVANAFKWLFGQNLDSEVQTSYLFVLREMFVASEKQFYGVPWRKNPDPDPDFGHYDHGDASPSNEFSLPLGNSTNDDFVGSISFNASALM